MLAFRTAIAKFGEDRFHLAVLMSQRLPAQISRPSAAVVAKFAPKKLLALRLLAVRLAHGHEQALRLLEVELGDLASANTNEMVRVSEVLTAVGEPGRGKEILLNLNDRQFDENTSTLAKVARARLAWYSGDMTEAVKHLEGAEDMEPLRSRWVDESEIFLGWSPALTPVKEYQPRPKVIAHVLTNSLPFTASGYALRSHEILRAQVRIGLEVHAVTRLGYPAVVGKMAWRQSETQDDVTYHRLIPWAQGKTQSARLQSYAESLLSWALEVRPAVLHTTTHFTNAIVARAVAQALGIPWVYEVRGFLADTWASSRGQGAFESERYKLFQLREKEAAMSATAVVTLGSAMADELCSWGVPREKILIVPNSVDTDSLLVDVSKSKARNKLGLNVDAVYVGTISSLVPYEGIDSLLRAGATVMSQFPRVRLLVVGDGSALQDLEALATQLGIADRTVFTGRVPSNQASLYYRALDLFVVPRKDTRVTRLVTPLKPVLARAMGLRVIGSDLPALNDLGADNLFEADNPSALASKISQIVEQEEFEISPFAPSTWKNGASEMLKLYEKLPEAQNE